MNDDYPLTDKCKEKLEKKFEKGKYEGLTVQQVLDCNPSYLKTIYEKTTSGMITHPIYIKALKRMFPERYIGK